jgi:sigma-B regulation protein RsbU (phosphoserine phosphatase)
MLATTDRRETPMSIRYKFLLILLGFSIVPLLVFFSLNAGLSAKMGQTISDVATKQLILLTSRGLEEVSENYALALNREFHRIETAIRSASEKIEGDPATGRPVDASHGTGNSLSQPTAILRQLFEQLESADSGLLGAYLLMPDGKTYSYPDVGPHVGSARLSLERKPLPAGGEKPAPLRVVTHYVEEDPSIPPVMSISLPVSAGHPKAEGIIGADYSMTRLLDKCRPASQWTPLMETLMVLWTDEDIRRSQPPTVLFHADGRQADPSWRPLPSGSTMDAPEIRELLLNSRRWGKGHAVLTNEGAEAIWACAQADHEFGFVSILPTRELQFFMTRSQRRLIRWHTMDTLLAAMALVLLMLVVASFRSRRILKPFSAIVEGFRQLSTGDFSARLSFDETDERQLVASAFNDMAIQLESSMQLRHSLEVAREVQQNFLPSAHPEFPGFDIASTVRYCDETGGDYIDFIQRGNGSLGVVVSDVTGHGIGAALLMATARALIRGRCDIGEDLSEMTNAVNRKLSDDVGATGRFMTLFFLEIDPIARRFQWIRAGHDPAWLFADQGETSAVLDGIGIPLGVESRYAYPKPSSRPFRKGDVVVIGTDGIWEAANADGVLFGKDRFEDIVRRNLKEPAAGICRAVIEAVAVFQRDTRQEDDISLAVVKVVE